MPSNFIAAVSMRTFRAMKRSDAVRLGGIALSDDYLLQRMIVSSVADHRTPPLWPTGFLVPLMAGSARANGL